MSVMLRVIFWFNTSPFYCICWSNWKVSSVYPFVALLLWPSHDGVLDVSPRLLKQQGLFGIAAYHQNFSAKRLIISGTDFIINGTIKINSLINRCDLISVEGGKKFLAHNIFF